MKTKNFLSKFEFFSDIPLHSLAELEQQCEILEFKENEIIFQVNKTAENLYGVINGEVELFITFRDKKIPESDFRYKNILMPELKILQTPIIVDKIRTGEIFGWSSMLDHKKWTASAKSISTTRIFSLRSVLLKNILNKDHATGHNIMQRLCEIVLRRLQARTERMFERKINAISKMMNFNSFTPQSKPQ